MVNNWKESGRRIGDFIGSQLREWDLAGDNYRDLDKVMVRSVSLDNGCTVRIQFNPARIRSSAAKVDKRSVEERPCFLCTENLYAEQRRLDFEGRYLILVNPFPIFKKHLTIPLREHEPQLIKGRFADMLRLADHLQDFTIFYNGPRCGASAPDHFHFQAGNIGFMPVESEYAEFPFHLLSEEKGVRMFALKDYRRQTLVIEGDDMDILCSLFERIFSVLEVITGDKDEPMMNILAGRAEDRWRVFVFPRSAHRPVQFFLEGSEQILLSPASVDLGGVFITPRMEDFEKLDAATVKNIFDQVSLGGSKWETLLGKLDTLA